MNGQEWNPITDLQYACVMPLREPVICGPGGAQCLDCQSDPSVETQLGNPLCNATPGANPTTTRNDSRMPIPGLVSASAERLRIQGPGQRDRGVRVHRKRHR